MPPSARLHGPLTGDSDRSSPRCPGGVPGPDAQGVRGEIPLPAQIPAQNVRVMSKTKPSSGASPVNEGGTLAIGALDNGGIPFLTSALLGYDVSSLAGQYASIESVTLTAGAKDQYPGSGEETVDLFRVADIHAAWTHSATWAQDGTGNP